MRGKYFLISKLGTRNSELEKMNLTEEILLKEGKMLPVMEHFYTLQGEGHPLEKLLIS